MESAALWDLRPEKEGLTIGANYEEEASGIFIGTPKDKPWYKQKEITKEEYDAYAARLADPNEPRGFYGLVNEKGKAAAEKAIALYNEKTAAEDAALVTYLFWLYGIGCVMGPAPGEVVTLLKNLMSGNIMM